MLRVHARGAFERTEHVALGHDEVGAFVYVKVSDDLPADDAEGCQPTVAEARLLRHRRSVVADESAAERFAEIGLAQGIFRARAGERRRTLDAALDEIDAKFEQRRLGLAQPVRLGPRRRLRLDEPPTPARRDSGERPSGNIGPAAATPHSPAKAATAANAPLMPSSSSRDSPNFDQDAPMADPEDTASINLTARLKGPRSRYGGELFIPPA